MREGGRERGRREERKERKELGNRNPHRVSDFLLWEKRIRMRRFAPVRSFMNQEKSVASSSLPTGEVDASPRESGEGSSHTSAISMMLSREHRFAEILRLRRLRSG